MNAIKRMFQDYGVLFLILILVVVYQGFFVQPFLSGTEVFIRANCAKWFIDGYPRPMLSAVVSCHYGVPLFLAFFLVPLFLVMGDTVIALYFAFVSIQVLTVILMYLAVKKMFTKDIALISAFLCACKPAVFNTTYYLHDCGVQSEPGFFSLLALYLLASSFFWVDEEKKYIQNHDVSSFRFSHGLSPFIAGIVSGFAFFVCFTNILFLISFGMGLLSARIFVKRIKIIGFFVLGFCLGILPLFFFGNFNLMIGSHTPHGNIPLFLIPFYKSTAHWHSAFLIFETISETFTLSLSHWFVSTLIPLHSYLVIILMAFFSLGVTIFRRLRALSRAQKEAEGRVTLENRYMRRAIVFFYLVVTLLANLLHPMPWPAKEYLLPAYPFLCITLALFIGDINTLKIGGYRFRSAAIIILLFVLLGSTMQSIASVPGVRVADEWRRLYKVRSVKATTESLAMASTNERKVIRSYIEYITQFVYDFRLVKYFDDLSLLRSKQIHEIYSFFKYEWYRNAELDISGINKPYKSWLLIPIGYYFGDGLYKENFKLVASLSADYSERILYFLHKGIARSIARQRFGDVRAFFTLGLIDRYVPRAYRHFYYREYGARIAEKYHIKDSAFQEIETIGGREWRTELFRGFFSVITKKELDDFQKSGYLMPDLEPLYWERMGTFFPIDKEWWSEDIHRFPKDVHNSFIQGVYYSCAEYHFYVYMLRNRYIDFETELWARREYELFDYCFERRSSDELYDDFSLRAIGMQLCEITFGELSRDFCVYVESRCDESGQASFFKGYGAYLARLFTDNQGLVATYINEYVPQKYQHAAFGGWEGERNWPQTP
jgi:4-amino-4-deoxy-L-arabinose transferase-like glycosyltransferase